MVIFTIYNTAGQTSLDKTNRLYGLTTRAKQGMIFINIAIDVSLTSLISTPDINQTIISQLSPFIDLNPYITKKIKLKFQL